MPSSDARRQEAAEPGHGASASQGGVRGTQEGETGTGRV